MKIQTQIRQKLEQLFQPVHLEVENESSMHSVPEGSETHFRILIVSDQFEGRSRVDRQRAINEALKQELKGGVHALSQRVLTSAEWKTQKAGGELFKMESPPCESRKKKK